MSTTPGNGRQRSADITDDADTVTYYAPPGALTWGSAPERNKLLRGWRRAVCILFGEQARCLRIAWALEHLFNTKTGYAYPSNGWLSEETGIALNKVQETLATLEASGVLVRSMVVRPGGQKQRVIYPGRTILRNATTPTVGVGGDPQQLGVQILRRKRPRLPKTELERAQLAATLRENNAQRDRGPTDGLSEDEHAAPPVTHHPPSKQRH